MEKEWGMGVSLLAFQWLMWELCILACLSRVYTQNNGPIRHGQWCERLCEQSFSHPWNFEQLCVIVLWLTINWQFASASNETQSALFCTSLYNETKWTACIYIFCIMLSKVSKGLKYTLYLPILLLISFKFGVKPTVSFSCWSLPLPLHYAVLTFKKIQKKELRGIKIHECTNPMCLWITSKKIQNKIICFTMWEIQVEWTSIALDHFWSIT